MKKHKEIVSRTGINVMRYGYLLITFLISDAWLRVITRWISRYSIYAFAPNCFTICWSMLLTLTVAAIRPRKASQAVYGILFVLSFLYSLIQYFAYQILGRFLYISDFLYASEGGDYKSYILGFMNRKAIVYILVMIIIGFIGICLVPDHKKESWKSSRWIRLILSAISICGIILAPMTYEKSVTYDGVEYVNNFATPSFEYTKFVNSVFDMELTGTYQFFARDLYQGVERNSSRMKTSIRRRNNSFPRRKNMFQMT